MKPWLFTLIIGVGATAVMDWWAIVRKPLLGIAPPNYALVGRWLAHMTRGRFRHDAIAVSSPMRGERLIGWTAHYLIGIAFAAVLMGIWGPTWARRPTIGPALVVGIGTVAAPFLLMQPGMGRRHRRRANAAPGRRALAKRYHPCSFRYRPIRDSLGGTSCLPNMKLSATSSTQRTDPEMKCVSPLVAPILFSALLSRIMARVRISCAVAKESYHGLAGRLSNGCDCGDGPGGKRDG